jgi:hypothetical protein
VRRRTWKYGILICSRRQRPKEVGTTDSLEGPTVRIVDGTLNVILAGGVWPAVGLFHSLAVLGIGLGCYRIWGRSIKSASGQTGSVALRVSRETLLKLPLVG